VKQSTGHSPYHRGNDVPWRVIEACRVQTSLIGVHVILPVVSLMNVREAEFPILLLLIYPLDETLSLFVFSTSEERT